MPRAAPGDPGRFPTPGASHRLNWPGRRMSESRRAGSAIIDQRRHISMETRVFSLVNRRRHASLRAPILFERIVVAVPCSQIDRSSRSAGPSSGMPARCLCDW
jgi:hypothetical protein